MVLTSPPLLLINFTTHSISVIQAGSNTDRWWCGREGGCVCVKIHFAVASNFKKKISFKVLDWYIKFPLIFFNPILKICES